MSEENTAQAPQGKGLAVGGFVLSLVGLIFNVWVMAAVTVSVMSGGGKGLAYFWIVLCLASVVLSVMGMMKLGKTGGKKGLAIAGMIIGIIAVIWAVMGLIAVGTLETAGGMMLDESMGELGDMLDQLEDMQ